MEIKFPEFFLALRIANKYLDAASLNALSATCTFIRNNIPKYFPQRLVAHRPWFKKRHVDGRIEWKMDKVQYKFSRVQLPNWSIRQNPDFWRELESHKKACPCKEISNEETQIKSLDLISELVGWLSME